MDIQNLSVTISAPCPNNCPYCVSRINKTNQEFNRLSLDSISSYDLADRMSFARDNNCNFLIITSTGETLLNTIEITRIVRINKEYMKDPFRCIELQTSGITLKDNDWYKLKCLRDIGINTIAIGLADPFDSDNNSRIMGITDENKFSIPELCKKIRELGFNLRIGINLTKQFETRYMGDFREMSRIFYNLQELKVDQVTFRRLYSGTDKECKQYKWIEENNMSERAYSVIVDYIKAYGHRLEKLPYSGGGYKYSIDGIATVIDDDCMCQGDVSSPRYMILRQDGKLYTRWDDRGSLIF